MKTPSLTRIRSAGRRTATILAVILCVSPLVSPAQNKSGALQAGSSMSNITPFLDNVLIGGFGSPVAKYIHDELYAKSLVLDNGYEQIAIVIADNCLIPREVYDEAREIIQKSTGIKKENVLMAATHTHSSVSAIKTGEETGDFSYGKQLDEYQQFVARRIADGVQRAFYSREPAKIGWGSVDAPEHVFNRRWFMKPGTDMTNPFGVQDKVRMNPGVANPALDKPAGPTDPEVFFVSVQALDGRPIALLANYSLHYVGGVPGDHVSSDYFGVFGDYFKKLIGGDKTAPGFVAMMSNGTSGNVNNINFRGPAEKMGAYQKMQIVAKDVADKIFKQYSQIQYKTNVTLGASFSELDLEVRKPTSAMLARAREVVANPDKIKLYHPLEPFYATRLIRVQERWPEKVKAVMLALRVDDLAIASIPFETFAETGLEIKEKSPFKSTFTISLANGWYGYLPTPEHHDLGGYETWLGTNYIEKMGSRKITDRLLEQLNAFK